MIFLGELTKITDEKYFIGFIHYMPFDSNGGLNKTKEELEKIGYLVDEMPKPDTSNPDKVPKAYFNPVTKSVFYEYEDRIKTPDEIKNNTYSETIMKLVLDNSDLKNQIQILSKTIMDYISQ